MGIPRARRSLSPAQQALALRRLFPDAAISINPEGLVWRGVITPTPLSRDYTIRISCQKGDYPRVMVVEPALERDTEGRLPHFFREGFLCVHENYQWDDSMLIVDTIVPWTAEWLAYYELWKRGGHWYGDGEPDDDGDPKAAVAAPTSNEPQNRAERRRREREQARRDRHGGGP
jgi:hypothetical protein